MVWNRKRGFSALLAALVLCVILTGCQAGSILPTQAPQATETVPDGQTLPGSDDPEVQEMVPDQTLPAGKTLTAVQCYYHGMLQREYALTYDESGRLSVLEIYTYSDGNLYSWGQNEYTYDEWGNLIANAYTHTLGSQRWDYENTYDDQGKLTGYRVTELYNGKLAAEYSVNCAYDAQGRYIGAQEDAEAAFDSIGRLLSLRTRVVTDVYSAEVYTEYDYSCMPVVLWNTHTVFPEYEQFSSGLRLMLDRYHEALDLDMKDSYQTVTDDQDNLTRVTDENGSDVYLFIY